MRSLLTISLCLCIFAFSACTSGNTNSDTDSGIRVSVTPATATVAKGATATFSATTTGTAVASVIWSVTGGDAYGTIDDNGVYTPPAIIPPQGTATVVASSTADMTQHGSAVVLVTRGPDVTFGTPIEVSDYAAGAYNGLLGKRNIAIYEGSYYIYTTWSDNRTGNYNVYFSRSLDSGVTFSAPIKINDDSTTAIHAIPSLAVSSEGVIYIAWLDERNGTSDVYFSRSLDNGLTFSANVMVDTPATANVDTPVIASGPGDIVYVAWDSFDEGVSQNIYVATSNDGGRSFAAPVLVNTNTLGPTADAPPDIAVDSNGNLYIVWSCTTTVSADTDVYISKSTNSGVTFSAESQINDDAAANSQRDPSITLDTSNNIYVAWMDNRAGYPGNANDIYMAKSTDGGSAFSANIKVNDSSDAAQRTWPVIIADPVGYLSVFWNDDSTGSMSIYYAASNDAGATYSAAIALDSMTGTDDIFGVATDSSGRLRTQWMDYPEGSTNADIYMATAQ